MNIHYELLWGSLYFEDRFPLAISVEEYMRRLNEQLQNAPKQDNSLWRLIFGKDRVVRPFNITNYATVLSVGRDTRNDFQLLAELKFDKEQKTLIVKYRMSDLNILVNMFFTFVLVVFAIVALYNAFIGNYWGLAPFVFFSIFRIIGFVMYLAKIKTRVHLFQDFLYSGHHSENTI